MACCLTAQAITWTNVGSVISKYISQPSIAKTSLKSTDQMFQSNLSGANELTAKSQVNFENRTSNCEISTVPDNGLQLLDACI